MSVSAHTLSHLENGKKAKLYIFCNIKEDAFDLFGFIDLSEKRCFELLISVTGVGPKAALAILSSCTPESLAIAVISDDERALTAAQGIGKKLAQRVILELKDKVSKEAAAMKGTGFAPPSAAGLPGSKLSDVSAALAVLGYSNAEISSALRGVDIDSNTVEDIIKEVLRNSLKG